MTNEILVEQIKSGHNELITVLWGNIKRFVRLKAIDYNRPEYIEDMEQEAFISMLEAIERFECRGKTFIGYYADYYLPKAFKRAVFGGNWERVESDPLNNSVSLETPTGKEDLTLMDMLVDPISEMDYRLVEEMDYWHSVAAVIQEAISKIPNPTSRNILELEYHNKISHKRGTSILNLAYDKYIYYYNEGKRALRRIIPALINRDRDKYELMEYIESSPFYSGSVSAWKGRRYTSSTESAALKLMQLEESIKLNSAIIEPAN